MIVYRIRQNPEPFCEFLVVPQNGKLCLPRLLPERYKHRVVHTVTFETEKCYQVESLSFSCESISYSSILEGNGVWIVSDDCNLKGGFGEVPPIRQFMSVPIEEESMRLLRFAASLPYVQPLALYHGTSDEFKESILTSGINVSEGMLGHAIYLGTLWKASRFATMTQTYEHRKGTIFRVLAFPKSICVFPREDWACTCEKCKKDSWACHIADHLGCWKKRYDCANAIPTKSEGLCRDGSKRYALRNEEWAVSDSVPIRLTHFSSIDPQSLAGPHHDPLHRAIKIS